MQGDVRGKDGRGWCGGPRGSKTLREGRGAPCNCEMGLCGCFGRSRSGRSGVGGSEGLICRKCRHLGEVRRVRRASQGSRVLCLGYPAREVLVGSRDAYGSGMGWGARRTIE